MICAALAMETSRSSLVPPNNTATFTASSLYCQEMPAPATGKEQYYAVIGAPARGNAA
jgi:hypothetical protein